MRDHAMLECMVAYAQSGQCRWRQLLEHLEGMPTTERCHTCDNCLRLVAHEASVEATPASGDSIVGPQAPAFPIGTRVRTRRHGQAEVVATDALSVTVVFDNGQTRSFQPQFLAAARRRGGSTPAPAPN